MKKKRDFIIKIFKEFKSCVRLVSKQLTAAPELTAGLVKT